MRILGIMSGSSLDGLDLVLCDIEEQAYKVLKSQTFSLAAQLKEQLKTLVSDSLIDYLNCRKSYSDFVSNCISEFALDWELDAISLHGHTCFHLPSEGVSLQLGDGARLSALTGYPVVTDFRSGDIALGGVGTPLVPIFEQIYLSGYDYYLNLGGIANITDIGSATAYDVCPCNQLLNYLAEQEGLEFDTGGKIGRSGALDQQLYSALSEPDYYELNPPKSIDNSWIKDFYFKLFDESRLVNKDKMHTSYQWITDQIIKTISRADAKVLITGGGAHNNFLIELLVEKAKVSKTSIMLPEKELVDFKEAILMCVMAYRRIKNQANILSKVTGASQDNIGGAIYDVHGKG